jgi:hypothetical protein
MFLEIDQTIEELKNSKIAIFHSHVLWPSHFETELELIELLNNKGASIVSYVCNDNLRCCDHSLKFDLFTCSHCILKREEGLKLVDKTKQLSIKLNDSNYPLDPNLSISEFVQLKHNNFDFGYAVLSSMIQQTRDPYITIKDHFYEFQKLVNNSIALYDYFIKSLVQEKIDTIFIFNGRFVHTRALLRAAEYLKINYYTHERGSSKNKFMLYKNTLPHDIDYFHSNMIHVWDNKKVDDLVKVNIANDFFHNRKNGRPKEWFSFIKHQEIGLLPDSFNPSKHNVVIYLSSEDEFSAIGDIRKRLLFSSQIEGLQFIFNDSFDSSRIHFYIRMHPNSSKSSKFIEDVKKFESNYITVLEPSSPVSTYHLLDNANKVITFGSTIGIEATFWGKPSINLDNAFYIKLDVTYNPPTKEIAKNLIKDINLQPLSKENAYPYGYYLSVFGYEYFTYKPNTLGSGTYKNIDLNEIKGIKYREVKRYRLFPYKWSKIINKYQHKIDYLLKTRI